MNGVTAAEQLGGHHASSPCSCWSRAGDTRRAGVTFYFATPYHSWERGTNENLNGLLRQYLPKRTSLAGLTQRDCDAIAHCLNTRPRKRLGYRTPEECIYEG